LEAVFAIDRDRVGKALSFAERRDLGRKTAFCFSGREKYDILINGKKIGGNARGDFII